MSKAETPTAKSADKSADKAAGGSAGETVASLPDFGPAPLQPIPVKPRFVLLSVLVVATCGLVYELISGTMASYLLGDSVTQWSLVIGVYLSAMGLGSWLSKYVEKDVHARFIQIQLIIALVGGFSAASLFLGFAYLASVRPLLFGILITVGTMVGLEIPLLMRILAGDDDEARPASLKDLVARVLAFDYLGSLAASVLFPMALLPYLGLVRTSLFFGLLNGAIALWSAFAFAPALRRAMALKVQAGITVLALAAGFSVAPQLEQFGESQLYDFPVIFSQKTPYQRLTITRWQTDIRLYIDGNLQFSSTDEHRYHEALVHPATTVAARLAAAGGGGVRALVLGGGDGLGIRELLKHPEVQRIDLVDLDPAMTNLFGSHPVLTRLNADAFSDPRVHVHNADAMEWLLAHRREGKEAFDLAIVDLPDPNNFSLGKLYTRGFYRLLRSVLTPGGVGVVQATSPYLAPRSYWCVVETLRSAQLNPVPYHTLVPSFGDWGFVLISPQSVEPPSALPPSLALRFLSDAMLPTMFVFPADQQPVPVEVNRLNDQMLVHYYEADLADPIVSRK
ncbi:MAG: polyamine aminopropyltransferase [Myxococcota bacterium]